MESVGVGSEGIEIDDEITIVKIVRPWSDDDIEIVYEKGSVPLPSEINKGPSDFVGTVCQCHSHHKVTVTPSDIVGVRESVILPVPRPHPHQNQCRASEEGESPDESPHDLHDVHHAKAQEASDCPLEAEEEMDIVTEETTQSEGNSVPPRGFDEGLNGSTAQGAQGSNSKDPDDNPPNLTMTRGVNPEEEEMALKDPATSERQPDPTDGSTVSEEGHNLGGGRKVGERSKARKRTLKPCCYFCQKTLSTLPSLEVHLATHTQEKPFPCPLCGKELRQRGHLNAHLRTHRKEREAPFICNLCGKGLTAKTTLEDHIRRHLKEKWFKCPHPGCTSTFVSSGELSQHSRVHSGERPFACPHPGCGKAFSQKSALNAHSSIHSGEKPFTCPHPGCTSSFVHGGNLRRHARVHSGEKPFACPYPNCGKLFTTKEGRDGHHRTHTGEKPFVCGCGKAYAVYVSLYSHRGKCAEGNRATKKRKICKGSENVFNANSFH